MHFQIPNSGRSVVGDTTFLQIPVKTFDVSSIFLPNRYIQIMFFRKEEIFWEHFVDTLLCLNCLSPFFHDYAISTNTKHTQFLKQKIKLYFFKTQIAKHIKRGRKNDIKDISDHRFMFSFGCNIWREASYQFPWKLDSNRC